MRRLADLAVAVTGASAGIGAALAVELARHGARLALGARRRERLDALLRELPGAGHRAIACDVSRRADCEAFVADARAALGRLDCLVCNAGSGVIRAAAETTSEEWQAQLAVNLFGTVDCVRAAVPVMAAQDPRDGWRGHVVIVSSVLSRRAPPLFAAYSATKAAQHAYAEALRLELKPRGIAVTSVHPAGTQTEFNAVAEAASARAMPRKFDLGRRQSAEAVARAMRRAIARPRAEVWPYPFSHLGFQLAGLFPALVDRLLPRPEPDR